MKGKRQSTGKTDEKTDGGGRGERIEGFTGEKIRESEK